MMLDREEYVEQAFFFRTLYERLSENLSTQDLLAAVRDEVLATTKLPMAIDYLLAELRHAGVFATAMRQMSHYFTPFQTYVIMEAENERSRFDLRVALVILEREAEYRSDEPTRQGLFFYQFESICRNRLRYDHGLQAIAADPIFDEAWREWILAVRRQIGMVDLADLVYIRSQHYREVQARRGRTEDEPDRAVLFGPREGKIALANRRKDPLLLFSALHRQLGYPEVPRPAPVNEAQTLLPQLARRLEQLEHRLKLVEEEQRGGIDLTKFYQPPGASG